MKKRVLLTTGLSLLGLTTAVQATQLTEPHPQHPSIDAVSMEVLPSAKPPLLLTQAAPLPQPQSASVNRSPSPRRIFRAPQTDDLGQVTSVSQLSDVFPTDWAFQAVQSLVERYGCIAGYPNGTFQGNRHATRYEMAAALNACLDQISDRFASKADIDTVKALQAEFAAELATLRGRVDGLEARVATVEAQQFSTTTKLQGEVIIAGQFGDFTDSPGNTLPIPTLVTPNNPAAPTFAFTDLNVGDSRVSVLSRVRLNFNTSFSGEDLLQTQLEVGNGGQDFFSAVGLAGSTNAFATPTIAGGLPLGSVGLADLGALDYAGVDSTVRLRRLAYSFKPFGEDFTLTVGSNIFPSDFIDFNSYANNSGQDFGSGFFINNPLIITNAVDFAGGAGAAFDWNVGGGSWSVRGLYIAANAQNPAGNSSVGNVGCTLPCPGGLGNDPHQASVELEYTDTFGNGKNNFAVRVQGTFAETFSVQQTVVGVNAELTLGRLGFFGRVGASLDPQVILVEGGQSSDLFPDFAQVTGNPFSNAIVTWMGGVAYRDLGLDGSMLALGIGAPYEVDDVPGQINAELFYRIPVSDNISLTPSVLYIFRPFNVDQFGGAPIGTESNIIQGVLRATFSF